MTDTTRRSIPTVAAAAATAAAGLAIGVAQPDPVFAATIAAHQRSTMRMPLCCWLVRRSRTPADADRHHGRPAKVMIETAPTTRGGLQVLGSYLGDERNRNVRFFIRRPLFLADGTAAGSYSNADIEAVDWLVAKHAAAIAV